MNVLCLKIVIHIYEVFFLFDPLSATLFCPWKTSSVPKVLLYCSTKSWVYILGATWAWKWDCLDRPEGCTDTPTHELIRKWLYWVGLSQTEFYM